MPRLGDRGKICVADRESILSNINAKRQSTQRARAEKKPICPYLESHFLINKAKVARYRVALWVPHWFLEVQQMVNLLHFYFIHIKQHH